MIDEGGCAYDVEGVVLGRARRREIRSPRLAAPPAIPKASEEGTGERYGHKLQLGKVAPSRWERFHRTAMGLVKFARTWNQTLHAEARDR